jgi:hypothetical protein
MRSKPLLTNLLLALALPLAPTGARADSQTGAANITIGSTAVFSGTAGLLYGDGALVRSLPGTVTNGSGTYGTSLALGNNVQLALTTDGTVYSAPLTLNNTSTTGGWSNMLEVYSNVGGTYVLGTYINNVGIYYSSLNMVISGHYSTGSGAGGHYGPGYSVLSPNNYYPNMYGCWADITGSCYQARNNTGAVGELSFSGQTHTGVFTIGLDAENSQFILGNTTISGSGQVFTGDTFIGRAAAANVRFGAADAASPVAQTISFQSVLAGASNTGGVNTIFKASAGTGTGAGGSFLFQTALPGSSGTAQNAFTTALTIDGVNGVTVAGPLNAGGSIIAKTRTVSAATDTISASTDYFLCVAYTSTGAVTENLPAGVAGQTFLIKDCGGAAASHPITITPASGSIDGGSSYSLDTNYGSVAVTYANSQWSVN